jgi:hypothetical protein
MKTVSMRDSLSVNFFQIKQYIDGSLHIPDNGSEVREFHVKARSTPTKENGFSAFGSHFSAPCKGRYLLSKHKRGSFWENPNNQEPVHAKLYRKGSNVLKGICSILNDNLCRKCTLFHDHNAGAHLFVKKSEINYNYQGLKSGAGQIYFLSDVASTLRVAIGNFFGLNRQRRKRRSTV